MGVRKEHFRIIGKIKLQFDLAEKYCNLLQNQEGALLDLEADIAALDKINAEVRKQLDTLT